MDQSRRPEKFDSADVFHRARIEENEVEKEKAIAESADPDREWDEKKVELESNPEYDSRASS